MQTSLRKMGNSTGMIVPKPLLKEMGLAPGATLDMQIKDGQLVARPQRKLREGWAESAAVVAAAEEDSDEAAWAAFGNDGDNELTW